jgi:hypothetical protein
VLVTHSRRPNPVETYRLALKRELDRLGESPPLPEHMVRDFYVEGIPVREAARRAARPTMMPGPERDRTFLRRVK